MRTDLARLWRLKTSTLFPMLKSSDVAKGRNRSDRLMIVPQRGISEDTSHIREDAPRTWAYLSANGKRLDGRRSVIYRGKPRFSIFGVGDYTFAPWKVAISGFYKVVRFAKVGPVGEKPVVFDDTVYFLPCWSEQEADFVHSLVESMPYYRLLHAMIFAEEKRPVTADVLKRISLEKVADGLGMSDEYAAFTRGRGEADAPRRPRAVVPAPRPARVSAAQYGTDDERNASGGQSAGRLIKGRSATKIPSQEGIKSSRELS